MGNVTIDKEAIKAKLLEDRRQEEETAAQDFRDLCIQWGAGTCAASADEIKAILKRAGKSLEAMEEKANIYQQRVAAYEQLQQALADAEEGKRLRAQYEAAVKTEDERRIACDRSMEPLTTAMLAAERSGQNAAYARQQLGVLPRNPALSEELKRLSARRMSIATQLDSMKERLRIGRDNLGRARSELDSLEHDMSNGVQRYVSGNNKAACMAARDELNGEIRGREATITTCESNVATAQRDVQEIQEQEAALHERMLDPEEI